MKVRTADEGASAFSRAWTIAAMFLMLTAAVFLASCGAEQGQQAEGQQAEQGQQEEGQQEGAGAEETVPTGEEEESGGQAIGVSIADVTDNPSEFYGRQITLSGLVTEVVSPNAVAIGGDEFVGGDEVLIVGAQQLQQIVEGIPEGEPFEIQQQDLVQATGTLREFNLTEVEEQVGYDLDDNAFAEFEGEPVLVADSFVLTPQQGGGTAAQAQQGTNVTVPMILDQPEEFYGRTITVNGAVAQIIDPNTFVIVEQQAAENEGLYDADAGTLADQGVLVATSNGPNLTERQTVQVTGTLQQFDVATFEQELGGVTFDENNEFISAFEGRPAIMASQIQQTQGGQTTSQ